MSSLVKFDLGEDANKTIQNVLDLFKKYSSLTVGTSGKDIANKYLDEASTKLKAEIDLMIQMVETKVQGLIDDGALNLYSSLGIDETVITFAKTMIKMADTATNIASSYLMKGMLTLNSFDVENLPYSAGAAALLIIKSFADVWYQKMMQLYGVYIDFIINFILDPGAALEALKQFIIDTALKMAEDILDLQMQEYLGITLAQAKFYCRKGYNLYKQYKAKKKAERDAKAAQKDEDLMESISASGSKKSVSVSVQVNSAVLKQQLQDWLKSQRDSLYSAFCILQIKDAINDIKDAVKSMTDISIESLAENINSLDDVINMLDEMGLGDDSTAVDLSMIPSLGLNDIMSSMQSLTDTDTLLNEGKLLAGGVAGSVMTSSTLNANIKTTKTYDISTDSKTKVITVKIYTDPTKSSISKKIYKVFSNAKSADDTKLFTPSECKVVQDTIMNLYSETHKGSTSVKLTKYTVTIELDIEDENSNSSAQQSGTESKGTNVDSNSQSAGSNDNSSSIELLVVEEERKTKALQEKDSTETRRNTISILHTVFSLIKSVFDPFKELAVLILNYKENKAYLRGKHYDNLITLFQNALKELGLTESKSFDTSAGQTASSVMYTVRTYNLYNYLKTSNIITDSDITKDISSTDARNINSWLSVNDKTATTVNESGTTLYIDYDSINAYMKCLLQQLQIAQSVISDATIADSLVSCSDLYKNGTFTNLEKVEVCEDRIIYSSSNLSRYPSLITSLKSKGYNADF